MAIVSILNSNLFQIQTGDTDIVLQQYKIGYDLSNGQHGVDPEGVQNGGQPGSYEILTLECILGGHNDSNWILVLATLSVYQYPTHVVM